MEKSRSNKADYCFGSYDESYQLFPKKSDAVVNKLTRLDRCRKSSSSQWTLLT